MFIKRITLRNFKSFKKAVIEFRDNFTVITGPNGSGKSNIIDSILFCLGLSSSKALRAEKLTDLIRNNHNEAEVTIELENLTIKRRIKKTDKGYYSYYYINGKSVNYHEVERILEDLGLNSEYNIVMQGDVTRIAEMSPFQRRKIIDDIAGISEFDEKKEKALQELEVVKSNIEKLEVLINEVESQLDRLKVERDEALRYKRLLEEKETFEYYLQVHNYLAIKNRHKKLEEEIERINQEKDIISKELLSLNQRIIELNSKAKELADKIESISDERLKSIQQAIVRYSSEIDSLKRLIDIRQKELKKLNNEKEKTLLNISRLRDELKRLQEELKELDVQRESLSQILAEKTNSLNELKDEFDRLSEGIKLIRDQYESKIKELEKLKELRLELLRERDRILEGLRRIGLEIEEIELERSRIEIKDVFDRIRQNEEMLRKYEYELEKLKRKAFELDKNIFSLRDELAKVEEEIKSKEVELAKVSVVQKPKAVEIIMRAKEEGLLKGIYGIASQLCSVDDRYALALEVAGGSALNFIVVENEDVAVKAVKYLKAVDGGRASFIPLNRVQVDLKLDKSVLNEDGVIDYAVNLVKCDEKFKPVFELIFRDTLVVEDIDTAKRFINKFRVVTLEGDLIEKSGVITGGSFKKKPTIGIFEKESKLKEELKQLKERRENLLNDISYYEAERRRIQSEIEEINSTIVKLKSQISADKSKIEEINNFLNSLENKLNEKKAEAKELNEKALAVEEKLAEVEKKIKDVEKDVKLLDKELLMKRFQDCGFPGFRRPALPRKTGSR